MVAEDPTPPEDVDFYTAARNIREELQVMAEEGEGAATSEGEGVPMGEEEEEAVRIFLASPPSRCLKVELIAAQIATGSTRPTSTQAAVGKGHI